MSTARITAKGQVTIPANVRNALRVSAGDRLVFVEIAAGRIEIIAATQSVRRLRGLFGKADGVVSIDDMNDAIANRPG